MPIRFRCAYCNQLMAISRRKAGTVVRCPTCGGQVIVPEPEPQPAAKPSKKPTGVFEQSDFDDVFQKPGNGPQPAVNLSPPAAGPAQSAPPNVSMEPVEFDTQAEGCMLTTGKLFLLGIIIIMLMALAFVAGLLIGRS